MKNKSNLLAAFFAVVAFLSLALAAATTFTSLSVTGNTTLGDAVTDVTTLTGQLALQSNAAPRTNVTPSRAGTLIWNSTAMQLCVSTGTTRFTWALGTSSTTVCAN